MPCEVVVCNCRENSLQGHDERSQCVVLRCRVGRIVATLKFDTDRKVVAGRSTTPTRYAGMPGTTLERHVLGHSPRAIDTGMCGHPQPRNRCKKSMGRGRQIATKKLVDAGTTELSGRQADAVNHDEIDRTVCGPLIVMRAQHLPDIPQQAGVAIDYRPDRPCLRCCCHGWRSCQNTRMTRLSFEALRALDLAHVWHPCTQMKDHEGELPLIPLQAGSGAWLVDMQGKRYLDAISSWWVNLWGHAHPQINAAIKEQLDLLPHAMLAGFTHEPAAQLAARLTQIAPPGLARVFFADSGSASIEIAVKMSFHYWQNRGRPRKSRFVTLANSYHGETLGALAVGNVELYKAIYRPLLMDVITVSSPDAYLAQVGETAEQRADRCADEVEALFAERGDEIAAILVEPLVQCAGSMRMYHPRYLQRLREACDRHGVHLIADEIAVGFGRTGTMFACEQAAVSPDFLCLSKGLTAGYLPMSVVLTRAEVYDAFYDEYTKLNAFLHSHSYAGSALACRAALASLDLFDSTNALTRNRVLSGYLGQRLQNAFGGHPQVSDIRQCGMIAAVEFVADVATKRPYPWRERRHLHIHRHALEQGVLLRPLGNVIYFMPPYIVTESQIDLMTEVAAAGLAKALAAAVDKD